MTGSRADEADLFSLAGDGILREVSEDFARLLDLSPEEVNGRSLLEFVHPLDTPAVVAGLSELQDGAPDVAHENRFISSDDGIAHVQWVARQVPGAEVWRATGQDTTEHHQLLAQIFALQVRLDLVVGHGTASMWDFDVRKERFTWDARAAQILGIEAAAVPRTVAEFAEIVQEEDSEPVLAALAEFLERGEFELEVRAGQGPEIRYLMLRGRIVERDHRNRPLLGVGLALDITAEKVLEEQMLRRAMRDALTGVPNRGAFDETLSTEARRCAREVEPLSVIMIDIDNFKGFNDQFGHLIGDAALIAVAGALTGSMRWAGDVLARFGGEEFAVVLPRADDRGAFAVAERLVDAVRTVTVQEAPDWKFSVSVGTASWHPGKASLDPVELLDHADQALYAAKSAGKDRAIAYAPA